MKNNPWKLLRTLYALNIALAAVTVLAYALDRRWFYVGVWCLLGGMWISMFLISKGAAAAYEQIHRTLRARDN